MRRRNQSREGSRERRLLEYAVVLDQVKRRKAQFIERLQRILHWENGHLIARATLDQNGYPRMNFGYSPGPGRNAEVITIHVMRVVAILRNCAPIPEGYEVAHQCEERRCVFHTELQHYTVNAATYKETQRRDHGKFASAGAPGPDVPF